MRTVISYMRYCASYPIKTRHISKITWPEHLSLILIGHWVPSWQRSKESGEGLSTVSWISNGADLVQGDSDEVLFGGPERRLQKPSGSTYQNSNLELGNGSWNLRFWVITSWVLLQQVKNRAGLGYAGSPWIELGANSFCTFSVTLREVFLVIVITIATWNFHFNFPEI